MSVVSNSILAVHSILRLVQQITVCTIMISVKLIGNSKYFLDIKKLFLMSNSWTQILLFLPQLILRNVSRNWCLEFQGITLDRSYSSYESYDMDFSIKLFKLKMWKCGNEQSGKTFAEASFTGHQNEKNFVGLATDGDYIACGSEDNSLYVYYKGKDMINIIFPLNRRNWADLLTLIFRTGTSAYKVSIRSPTDDTTRTFEWFPSGWGQFRVFIRGCLAS